MSKAKELAEYEQNLKEYEKELHQASEELSKQKQQVEEYASNIYKNDTKQNIIEWELDFKSELNDIARSLRCDVLRIDEDGNEVWQRNPNPERIFLNELGVNDVLRKVISLVNKNKVLSNYTIEEIKARVRLIGHEIRALIYNNYEEYGIDNEYKMNNYSSIVLDVTDIIESAYRRALGGETHKGLNEQRIVTQNDNLNVKPIQQQQNLKPKIWNPATWGR